jgi:predicted Rossmann fold nucleotide-binding protein DprA/Smf involved in DNA uptake
MAEDEMIELLKKISEDIGAIKKYLRFQARDAIIALLNQIATTPERQQIWRLCEGTRSTDQIASETGVALRSVQYFLQQVEDAGLVVREKRGYPKRIEDIIPSEWKPWKPKKVSGEVTAPAEEVKPETTEETKGVE